MIPLYKAHIPARAAEVIDEVLSSGQISGDGRVVDFEQKLQAFIGTPHVVATAEFSRSIEMALRMAGVGPGDAVLASPLACLATTMPMLQVGARPVWCDVDPTTGSLAAAEIRRHESGGIKAVLFYHWVGSPGDIHGVLEAARELGAPVIEDAGEALGAEYAGKRVGAHGADYSVFSFSPVRHITTGEGAAIACARADDAARARLWRRYGIPEAGFRDAAGEISQSCDIPVAGMHNYMNRVAGALGSLQADSLRDIVCRHQSNGRFYDEALRDVAGIRLLRRATGTLPSHWVYCFSCERRDDLRRALREAGIYASTVHARNDIYSCFGTGVVDLPGVAEFERTQLCVPSGWWVRDEDRRYIVDAIRRGW